MVAIKKTSKVLSLGVMLLCSVSEGYAAVSHYITCKLHQPSETLNPDDFKGMATTPPGWTGYPKKTLDGEPIEYDIALEPKPADLSAGKADNVGFQPRNLIKNMTVDPRDSLRQAMPIDLPHSSLSLYVDANMTTVRPAVIEWLNLRYRNELHGASCDNAEALPLIRDKGITYANIWFWDPRAVPHIDGRPIELRFDEHGRPINPYPYGSELNVRGRGFYFFFGENPAVDPLITLELKGKIYALFIQRNEAAAKKSDGAPSQLSFPGGMHDIDKTQVDPLGAIFKELGEETGVFLDSDKIIRSGLAHLVSSDVVSGEARTTRNAWTTSHFYHLHFNNIEEFTSYIKAIRDDFDGHEVAKVLLLDVRYVLSQYVIPGAEGSMFASHGKMFTHALVNFFEKDHDKIRYLEEDAGSYVDYRASRLRMSELKAAIEMAAEEAASRELLAVQHRARSRSNLPVVANASLEQRASSGVAVVTERSTSGLKRK
jgi:hypothetical protein